MFRGHLNRTIPHFELGDEVEIFHFSAVACVHFLWVIKIEMLNVE